MGYRGELLTSLADPLERGVRRAATNMAQDVGRSLRRHVRRHTPVAKETAAVLMSYPSLDAWVKARGGRPPGTLKDSWQVGEVEVIMAGTGERRRIAVYTLDPVAPHVEWDTRPHLILPKRAKVLTIPTARGMVYATEAHHPGTRGVHMMATALAEVAAEWMSIAARQWRNETNASRFWRAP